MSRRPCAFAELHGPNGGLWMTTILADEDFVDDQCPQAVSVSNRVFVLWTAEFSDDMPPRFLYREVSCHFA